MDKLIFNTNNVITDEQFLQNQCDMANKLKGKLNELDGINCEKCNNRGYYTVIKDNDISLENCECMKLRNLKKRELKSGLGEYLKLRSKDYQVIEPWQNVNKEKLKKYCFNTTVENKWFIACGQSGCGKTLMCCIIANHYLYNLNKNVMYITWTDFIGKLKRNMMSDNSDLVSLYFDEIKNVEVLYIDELLKTYNDTDLKYIIELINYRYCNNLVTLITTERSTNELLNIDEATFSRVLEKCGEYVLEVGKDREKNWRIKNRVIQ